MKVSGVVKAIKTKEWNGRTMYNLIVDTGDGQGTLYGFGTDNPGVREETAVEFEAKQNQKGFWVGDAKTIQVQKTAAPQPAPSGGNAKPASGGGFQDRQKSITLQTAFKVATEQANGMLANGIFKPAMNSKAAKENAMEAYGELIKQLAAEMHVYFNDPEKFEEDMLKAAGSNKNQDNSADDDGEFQDDQDLPF